MSTDVFDDAQLDALLRALDPIDRDGRPQAPSAALAAELHESIADRSAASAGRSAASAGHRRYRRPAFALLAVSAAAAAALVVTLVSPTPTPKAYAAQLVSFAEKSPRLLVTDPGWRVSSADQNRDGGQQQFRSGPGELDLDWRPGRADAATLVAFGFTSAEPGVIDGHVAFIGYTLEYGRGPARIWHAMWTDSDQLVQAEGVFADRASFLAVAATLHSVDVNTWLDAMPPSVVKPDQQQQTVRQMLADIPQPPGFDTGPLLQQGPSITDRYQLGAAVTGAVTCAWISRWTGGTARVKADAAHAMASSRDWPVLQQMKKSGDFSDVVWEAADYMNGTPLPNTDDSFDVFAHNALGCE